MARIVTPERLAAAAAAGVDLAVLDAVFTGVAVEQPHADFMAVVRHYLDPDGPEPDPTDGRRLTLVRHADGSISIRGELDAVGEEKVHAALESHVQADRPAGDERCRAQRLRDAFVQRADTTLAAGSLPVLRTVKPHVAVVIDLDDLIDPTGGPTAGRMGFGAVISAARARWIACDATVSRVVMGPDGHPSTSAGSSAWPTGTCAGRWSCATAGACSPAATPPPGGRRCTTWCTGSTAAPPTWTTPPCCASGTTARSTTASAWSDNPTDVGAPGAPTVPRSAPDHRTCTPRPDRRPGVVPAH